MVYPGIFFFWDVRMIRVQPRRRTGWGNLLTPPSRLQPTHPVPAPLCCCLFPQGYAGALTPFLTRTLSSHPCRFTRVAEMGQCGEAELDGNRTISALWEFDIFLWSMHSISHCQGEDTKPDSNCNNGTGKWSMRPLNSSTPLIFERGLFEIQ